MSFLRPPPGPPPAGHNGGDNNDGDRYSIQQLRERGYHECMTNLFDQDQSVRGLDTNTLNTKNQTSYEFHAASNNQEYKKTYQDNDLAFDGHRNPMPRPEPLVRVHLREDKPRGEYYASPQEIDRRSQVHFNANAHEKAIEDPALATGRALQQFLDLADNNIPRYFTVAIPKESGGSAQISHNVRGAQQAKVDKRSMEILETRPIQEIFSYLRLKP